MSKLARREEQPALSRLALLLCCAQHSKCLCEKQVCILGLFVWVVKCYHLEQCHHGQQVSISECHRSSAVQDIPAHLRLFTSPSPCRVIALAYKQLGSSTTASDLRTMPRAEIEKDLSFGGFAVLRCPLKAESEPALKMLKESSHQLVMITGDAPLTACYTAAQVHIVDRPVLLLVHRYAPTACCS